MYSQNYYVKEMCLAATSEANYKELNKVSNAKNETALKQMFQDSRAVILDAKTKVFRLEGIVTYKVRVLSGPNKDRILYVAMEFVKKE